MGVKKRCSQIIDMFSYAIEVNIDGVFVVHFRSKTYLKFVNGLNS